jgi:hypothetical protein
MSDTEQLAYYYWLQDGKPEGKALQHWTRAEETLLTFNPLSGVTVRCIRICKNYRPDAQLTRTIAQLN